MTEQRGDGLRCPDCRSYHAGPLAQLNVISSVDYYRCADCAHVWTVSRDGLGTVAHITTKSRQTLPRRLN
jgi:DNA-directed RNA polymerase subunit RPC12/RpoP